MPLVVHKYGGSSVADAEKIKRVARRIASAKVKGNDAVVVVSARGDTTDELLELAYQVCEFPSEREIDMLLATGEQISIALVSMALHSLGYDAISFTGAQGGIITDTAHTNARIVEVKTDRILRELEKGKIVIVAGFQGVSIEDEITTLGRGGSDTTAVALAAVLKADVCEIYTDVEGVYTADPRVVEDARKIDYISYDEMLELASLGAQVLQLRAVEFAKRYGVKIHVRSSFNNNRGTTVEGDTDMMEKVVVRGITHDANVTKMAMVSVPDRPGIAARLFKAVAARNINIRLIVQGVTTRGNKSDISFIVSKGNFEKVKKITEGLVDELAAEGVLYDEGVALVSIVGLGIANTPGVAADMFATLAAEEINIEMISTSEIKISCLIREEEVNKAVKALHQKFISAREE